MITNFKIYENKKDTLKYNVSDEELKRHGYIPENDSYVKKIPNSMEIYCYHNKEIEIGQFQNLTKKIVKFYLQEYANNNFKTGKMFSDYDYLKFRYNINTEEIISEDNLMKRLNVNMVGMLSNGDYYQDNGWWTYTFVKSSWNNIINELTFLTDEIKSFPHYEYWELKNMTKKYNL